MKECSAGYLSLQGTNKVIARNSHLPKLDFGSCPNDQAQYKSEYIKRSVSSCVCTIKKNERKKLDDVKPWKQGKDRDSNRSCQSIVLTFPVEGKNFCTCKSFSCTMGISPQLKSLPQNTFKHMKINGHPLRTKSRGQELQKHRVSNAKYFWKAKPYSDNSKIEIGSMLKQYVLDLCNIYSTLSQTK